MGKEHFKISHQILTASVGTKFPKGYDFFTSLHKEFIVIDYGS